MTSRRLIYFLFAGLIAGILLLVYIQYNSAGHINNLIGGNEKLLNEIQVSRELADLEKNLLTAESRIRGTMASGDSSHIIGLDSTISRIESSIEKLQQISDDDSSVHYVDKLDELVRRKIQYNHEMLDALTQPGRANAASLFSANTGKSLTDSIITAIGNVERIRKIVLEKATRSADNSGKKALRSGTILFALILISALIVFWYIINIIRKQVRLINELNESEKKIRDTAAVKEKFMANMSHEIRTPMNAILGFTRLLEGQTLNKDARGYVETIRQSGENLLTIINDILDLSKIEAGMLRIEKVPFSIRDTLHSVDLLFREKAREKGIELQTRADDSLPDRLEGDPVRLMQILVNLVSNALKFTDAGSIRVELTNKGIAADKILAGITVSDTGIGISKEKCATVFDRFQQADDTVTRKYGGTGLGLSIVKELVTAQEGEIEVNSTTGKGAVFSLVIPYQPAREMPGNRITGITDTSIPARLKPVHIAVAEDNEINQRLLRHLFDNRGLQYSIVNNGAALLELLKQQPADLVLMDIQMPVMDGYTATRIIRDELKLSVPLIAMTAHAMTGEKEKCLQAGMDDYLSKPLHEEELFRLIEKYSAIQSPQTVLTASPPFNYEYIDLRYLKELSGGSLSFEKTITGQFIEAMPEECASMKKALEADDLPLLRKLVHNFRTSIAVMGLQDPLRHATDPLEYEELSSADAMEKLEFITRYCLAAAGEAKHYYDSL